MRGALLGALLLVVGCSPTVPEGRFACGTADDCPDGWSCVAGLCYAEATGVDAGGPADSGAPTMDAGPDGDAGPDTDAGPGDGGSPPDGGCPGATTFCVEAAGCVDLMTDDAHCGACGEACAAGGCVDGVCRPSVARVFSFGASGTDVIRAVEVLDGQLIVVGEFRDTVDFGGGTTRTSAGDVDGFVASYAPDGTLGWVVRIGASQFDAVLDVAVDPARGRVVAVGEFDPAFDGTATVETPTGTETISAVGMSADGFALALDGADGSFEELMAIAGPGGERENGVAIDGSGNIFIAGQHDFPVTAGGVMFPNRGFYDGHLVRWDPASNTLSDLLVLDSEERDAFDGISIVDTNVCASGYYGGPVTLGGAAVPHSGGEDGIVVCISAASGAYAWHARIGTTGNDQIHEIHWRDGASFAFVAVVGAEATFGSETIPAPAGVWDLVVGTMTTAGAPGWARVVSTPADYDYPLGVRVLSDGRVAFAALTAGAATSPVPLSHAGGNDGFVGVWTADGALSWARTFGGAGDDTVQDVVELDGSLYAVGEFTGPVDFGTGTIPAFGALDAFVMQILP